jgi:hypothetical protein
MISDWFHSLFIFLVFIVLLSANILNSGVQNLQDNWALYRCNPIMMPFAGYIAPDGTSTQDNFSFCIQSIISNFAPTITQPFSYLQTMTADMMDSINTSTASSLGQTSWLKDGVSGIIANVYSIFLNVIVEFNIIVIKLIDTQGKISGIIATVLYIMTAVQYTFESMWNGIPGVMIKTIGKL